MAHQVTIEIRDGDLNRVGAIADVDLTAGKFIRRYNQPGAWQLTLPKQHPLTPVLRAPRAGMICWVDGRVHLSGPMVQWAATETSTDPEGHVTFSGVGDMIVLADPLTFPDPTNPDVSTQTVGYDVRTGPAETVIKQYADANVGPSAPPARRGHLASFLTVEESAGLGDKVTGRARFDQVGQLMADLVAAAGNTIGFRVTQQGLTLVLSVYPVRDRTDYVRMNVADDTLTESTSGVSAPAITRAIVAGQGEEELRQFVQVVDDESTATEQLWGRQIETFLDQRQTSVVDELTQRGVKELTEKGRTTVSLKVNPSDSLNMRYGDLWDVGDIVAVVVDNQLLNDTVTEAIVAVNAGDVKIGATVGDPVGYEWEAAVTAQLLSQGSRLSALERAR